MIVISRRRGRSNPLSVGATGEPGRHRLDPGSFGEILSKPQAVCKVLTPAPGRLRGRPPSSPLPAGRLRGSSPAAVGATSPGLRVRSRCAQTLRCPDKDPAHCTEEETEAKRGQVSWPRQPRTPKKERLDLNPVGRPETSPTTAPPTVPTFCIVVVVVVAIIVTVLIISLKPLLPPSPRKACEERRGGPKGTPGLCFRRARAGL